MSFKKNLLTVEATRIKILTGWLKRPTAYTAACRYHKIEANFEQLAVASEPEGLGKRKHLSKKAKNGVMLFPKKLPDIDVWHSSRKRMKHGKKNVKRHVFWILKKNVKNVKKRRCNNVLVYRPEDHGDHPQSVLLSFTQLPKLICGTYLINNEQF